MWGDLASKNAWKRSSSFFHSWSDCGTLCTFTNSNRIIVIQPRKSLTHSRCLLTFCLFMFVYVLCWSHNCQFSYLMHTCHFFGFGGYFSGKIFLLLFHNNINTWKWILCNLFTHLFYRHIFTTVFPHSPYNPPPPPFLTKSPHNTPHILLTFTPQNGRSQ